MDTVKGVLLALTFVLLISTFYLFVQSSSQSSQLEAARETNKLTLDLLRAQGAKCSATPTDFRAVNKCIQPLLMVKDFKEDGFGQPDDGEPGYVVIKNVNSASYESANFTFFYNREQLQEGCTITGNITKGVTCRFNFPSPCVDGDVLEVMYTRGEDTAKVFTKTC